MIIEFSKLKFTHIYLLLCPISMMFMFLFLDRFGSIFDIRDKSYKANIYLPPLLNFLSHCLLGILWLIQVKKGYVKRKRSLYHTKQIEMAKVDDGRLTECSVPEKPSNAHKIEDKYIVHLGKNQYELNLLAEEKSVTRYNIKSYIILIVMNFLALFTENMSNDHTTVIRDNKVIKKDEISILTCTPIRHWLFAIASSIFLHNSKLYKHHYFALILVTFTFILQMVLLHAVNDEGYMGTFEVKNLFIMNAPSIFFSVFDVLFKKHSLKTLESPYKVLTFLGLFGIPLIFVAHLAFFAVPCKAEIYYFCNAKSGKYALLWHNITFDGKFVFFCLGFMILNVIQIFMIYNLILSHSPNHFVVSASLFNFIYPFTTFNKDTKAKNIVIHIVSTVLILFGNFIFNELIILNFWGLGDNTFLRIDERQRDETMLTEGNKSKDEEEEGNDEEQLMPEEEDDAVKYE